MAKLLILNFMFNLVHAHVGHNESEISPFSLNTEYHVWLGLLVILFLFLKVQKYASTAHKRFFLIGWSALVLALLSSIDLYSEKMASIHMLQHTLILMVAAPSLAIAGMDYYSIRAIRFLNKTKIKRLYSLFTRIMRKQRTLVSFILYASTLYIWHIPKFYNKALSMPYLHDLQHILFFFTSYLFWRAVFNPYGVKLSPTIAITYLFVSMLHAMVLGAMMGLSSEIWYNPYIESAELLGIKPLRDQQIAGLIMWMPAGITFIISSLWSVKRILSYSSRPIK